MGATDRSGRTREQRILLKSLYDAAKGGETGGILQPVLTNIKEQTDQLEPLSDEQISRAARKLHQENVVMSEDSFRPRSTFNPTIALTPKGWDVLADMGFEMPDEWYDVFNQILKILYERERDYWNKPTSRTYLFKPQIADQIDADYAVIEHFFEYMQHIEYIMQTEDDSGPKMAYEITERGAQAYENRVSDSEPKGFE
jgi:hypothetical protein